MFVRVFRVFYGDFFLLGFHFGRVFCVFVGFLVFVCCFLLRFLGVLFF